MTDVEDKGHRLNKPAYLYTMMMVVDLYSTPNIHGKAMQVAHTGADSLINKFFLFVFLHDLLRLLLNGLLRLVMKPELVIVTLHQQI